MSFEALSALPTTTLVRFAAAVALFAVLHLVRLPFVLAAALLAVSLSRIGAYASRLTTSEEPPVVLARCAHHGKGR